MLVTTLANCASKPSGRSPLASKPGMPEMKSRSPTRVAKESGGALMPAGGGKCWMAGGPLWIRLTQLKNVWLGNSKGRFQRLCRLHKLPEEISSTPFLPKKLIGVGEWQEQEFLSRLFNLSMLPSTDNRFKDAAGDIWQHRINNFDWEDDWIFYDGRFGLMNGDDENFLAFLCETIHPVVRPDPAEAERICQLYNQYLRNDGFQIVEKTRLSGKPVFVGRHVGIGV